MRSLAAAQENKLRIESWASDVVLGGDNLALRVTAC